jgi:retinol dehydrogenase 12
MNEKRTALVTGGTSGVGLSIVKRLIADGYRVAFIGSSNSKGKALEHRFNSIEPGCAEFICLDLSKVKDVDRFAEDFASARSRLDLLVNVAGVLLTKRELTEDGFEKTFAIGYLSAVILSIRLADILKHSDRGRIVNVSASPGSVLPIRLDFDDLSFAKGYKGFRTALLSVHAKTVLTELLAERFVAHGIDVNAFHPGVVRSDVTRNMPRAFRILAKLFSPLMSRESANGIYVSGSETLKGVSGQLFANKKPLPLRFDALYKERLWQKTHELLETAGVRFTRAPNYKVGWLVPGAVAALTHFHAAITPEDIAGVESEAQTLLRDVQAPFHIVIDNRVAPLDRIYTLDELQRASPLLRHPHLTHLIIVKPAHLELPGEAVERRGNVCLKNVASIDEAIDYANETVPGLHLDEMAVTFFEE